MSESRRPQDRPASKHDQSSDYWEQQREPAAEQPSTVPALPATPPAPSPANRKVPAADKDVTSIDSLPGLSSPEKRPVGRQTLLTPERQQTIVSYIRAGMWDYIAAEAAGINQDTFYEWLRRGDGLEGRPAESPFTEFSEAVRQARAEARGSAEIEVKREAPTVYLTKGPGRERPGRPGWTSVGDGQTAQTTTTVNVLIAPQWITIRTELLQTLEAFPEARAAIAHVLSRLDGQPPDDE
jgi:hypothetical protein